MHPLSLGGKFDAAGTGRGHVRCRRMIRSAAALLALLLTGVGAQGAAPRPGGVYPLIPGIYVSHGSGCADPANAVIRQYDGQGLSGAHSRACVARVLARAGRRYTVRQSCIDAGAGPAPRVAERQVVTVLDARRFTLATRGPATLYRYCPPAQLPAGLRSALRSPA